MTEVEIQALEDNFYVCPHHQAQGGYESCCACGGWAEGEEQKLCTEAIN